MGEWKSTGCNFCAMACNMQVYVEDDHILDVRPDPNPTRTEIPYCCRKGRSIKYFQENPERLNYPLKKVGDHYERISWEQAYREIGEKARAILDKYGPRVFAFVGGALANDQSDYAMASFIWEAIGSQYIYTPAGLEFMGHWWSNGRQTGNQGYFWEEEYEGSDVFVLWGANSYVSHNLIYGKGRFFFKEWAERPDKKVVVIDPRLSESARMADMHIQPRPGTDAVLARGLIALMLDLGIEDKEYLRKWCSDWDKARKWYEGFDYRKAFEFCEVPYEQMEEFAKMMKGKTVTIHQDLGIFCNRHNTISSFLINTVCAITGNFLLKGNKFLEQSILFAPLGWDERKEGVWRTVETNRFPVGGSYPTGVLAREMLSDKVDRHRVVFVTKSNPVCSYPDSLSLREGFDKLDLMVAVDIVPTETTYHADYVLPGKTGFEDYQFSAFTSCGTFMKHPIIGQIEEREDDCRILLNIAKAMGLVPEVPDFIYKAAAKSVKDRDILPFLMKTMGWLKTHPKYEKYSTLIMIDALSRPEALGNVARTLMRMALVISPLGAKDDCERAGFYPLKKYRFLTKLGPAKAFADMSKMDQTFWAVDDNPSGAVISVTQPDPEKYAREHIYYPDKKIRLWDETIDKHLEYITPEKEAAALEEETAGYPLLISSGNHEEGGVNGCMRNPDTYAYRNPYTILINPADAEAIGIEDGEEVRVSTKRTSIVGPAEVTYRAPKGYTMMPHHYGYEKNGKIYYGEKASQIVRGVDMDPITGNPYLRFVPCRIDKIQQ
ncbi:MAG: molybdopterin-dependent oxidoreductase [Mogibacterium sp.]|nr:molybdopterin-dependent oxidoreductase [Mogibacterium sp.]